MILSALLLMAKMELMLTRAACRIMEQVVVGVCWQYDLLCGPWSHLRAGRVHVSTVSSFISRPFASGELSACSQLPGRTTLLNVGEAGELIDSLIYGGTLVYVPILNRTCPSVFVGKKFCRSASYHRRVWGSFSRIKLFSCFMCST